jgi:hypothetical protein
MAHYFLFPEKDATIYAHPTRNTTNTGIDEILSIKDEESFTDLNFHPSRILIQFKQSEIDNVINNIITGSISASLKLFQTEHVELSVDQHFEIFPLAESWVNGTGRLDNVPAITNGCSWQYRDGSPNAISTGFISGVTASYSSSNEGGGAWYTGSGFQTNRSYGFNDDLDIELDITSPIIKHYSSSTFSSGYPEGIINNGFILKRSESQEFTAIDDGELNFFSMDTHTIFPPFLDISWDDSEYDREKHGISDNQIKTSGECYVTLRNNKEKFRTSEEYKFRLNIRELYPTRRFVTSSNFLDVNYFTSRSFYSLVDYATEEVLIPFGEESKLSADAEGMHFKIYMNGLQEERYYKLLFKHENNDGVQIYDDNYYFKVVKS